MPTLAPAPERRLLSGTELILATKPFAKESALRSWWCVLSTGVLLLAALAGAVALPWLVLRIASSILAGFVMMRAFVIYHDQQHNAILPRSKLAEGLMRGFGMFALSPSAVWRSSHDHHHAHNSKLRGSHIGSYPIMTKEQFRKSSPASRRLYLFIRHPLTILFGYVFMFFYGMCVNPFRNDPRDHWEGLVAIVIHGAVGAMLWVFFGWQAWLLVQFVPHFLMGVAGAYFFYAQHNFPGVSFCDSQGWTYEKAALESSSFLRTSRLMAWFSGNIGYHHIHHLNAKIPFYRLPEVFRSMPELQSPKVTTLSPRDIVRCLRLKVWDVEAQEMVGVRGL